MAKDKRPFSDFFDVMNKQTKEIEKLITPMLDQVKKTQEVAGPIIEYQKDFLRKSIELQKTWIQDAISTTEKVLNHIGEEHRKRSKESDKIITEAGLPSHMTDFIKGAQKLQENWLEQIKNTTKMMEDFLKEKSAKK
ncbi:MAG: hypothetical protein ACRENZ_11030 [Thermodesulfobacteriota bacterium]